MIGIQAGEHQIMTPQEEYEGIRNELLDAFNEAIDMIDEIRTDLSSRLGRQATDAEFDNFIAGRTIDTFIGDLDLGDRTRDILFSVLAGLEGSQTQIARQTAQLRDFLENHPYDDSYAEHLRPLLMQFWNIGAAISKLQNKLRQDMQISTNLHERLSNITLYLLSTQKLRRELKKVVYEILHG